MKAQVVVTRTADMDMRRDYVALPKDYGTKQYYEREDIVEIYRAVYENLDRLDKETGYSARVHACEKILIKPNLVSV